MATFGRQRAEAFDRAAKAQYYRDNIAGLTAYERHTKLIQDALSYDSSTPGAAAAAAATANAAAALAGTRTDADVLREGYRFIRDAADDVGGTWEVKLARKYYARLFKEYAIADLSRYKQGAIGLRWRTHAEVVSGKGQFVCGGRGCDEKRALASFEVPFGYKEAGQAKQALVKLRLCPRCAGKLSYKRGKEEQARQKGRAETKQREREEERQEGKALTKQRERKEGRQTGRVEKQQREREEGQRESKDEKEKGGGGERGSKRRQDSSREEEEEGGGRNESEAGGRRSKRRRSGSKEAAAGGQEEEGSGQEEEGAGRKEKKTGGRRSGSNEAAAVHEGEAAGEAGQATRHERWLDGGADEAGAGRERRTKQRRGVSEGVRRASCGMPARSTASRGAVLVRVRRVSCSMPAGSAASSGVAAAAARQRLSRRRHRNKASGAARQRLSTGRTGGAAEGLAMVLLLRVVTRQSLTACWRACSHRCDAALHT